MNVTLAASTLIPLLGGLLHSRVGPTEREWFDQSARSVATSPDLDGFIGLYTEVARHLGKVPLRLEHEERERLRQAGVDWPITTWGVDELGRVTFLLMAATHLPAVTFERLVDDCYRHGDNRERQAVLRALPLLPDPERFVSIGVDACRTHIQPIFEAIACENPYPATYFPELNFNQMVLKALFLGVAVERIAGLEQRVTLDLQRMAMDYASERQAAGRSIPGDVRRLTGERESVP